jgi:hypothetical protein
MLLHNIMHHVSVKEKTFFFNSAKGPATDANYGFYRNCSKIDMPRYPENVGEKKMRRQACNLGWFRNRRGEICIGNVEVQVYLLTPLYPRVEMKVRGPEIAI